MTTDAPRTPITLEELVTMMDRLQDASIKAKHEAEQAVSIIQRQTKMLDMALELFIDLAEDNDVPIRVRRRLIWILQQMRLAAQL